MSPERWRALEPLLDAALELMPDERAAFVREASHGDQVLHDELTRLVSECVTPDESLDEALQESFAELIEEAGASELVLPPALAERFRIKGKIRRGRNASVYLARDVRHDRDVAVKVLLPALAAIIGGERFLAEIRVTANLRHPHIVPLFESGEADGCIYYVMPLIEGETLRARMERDGALPVTEVVSLLRYIADAVAYAHQNGVVHLDIKPDNILLGAGGPVVADFGVAKALRDSPLVAAIDAGRRHAVPSTLVAGTPGYMSPEQLQGRGDVDARSDVYSLGVVAYEMLSGKRIFSADSLEELRDAHLYATPTPLSELRPDVPHALSAAVHRALRKNRGVRFVSAAQFRAGLDLSDDARREVRPSPWRTVATVAAIGLVMAVSFFALQWRLATTDTAIARRFFEAGLVAQSAGNGTEANRQFLAAIEKDSTLAVAAIGAAGYAADSATWVRLVGLSVRHVGNAPIREQLRIRLFLARGSNDPTAFRIADSLRTIDPQHPEGDFEAGHSLVLSGDYLAAMPYFRRAIDLDSSGLADSAGSCIGCQAFEALTWAYFSVDSLEAGERVARESIARGSNRYHPWFALAWSFAHRGMLYEAMDAWRRALTLNPSLAAPGLPAVQLRLFLDDYASADRLLDSVVRRGQETSRGDALWWSMISLRNQGRFRDAFVLAEAFDEMVPHSSLATTPRAVLLLETGRYEEARVLFESLTNSPARGGAGTASLRARQQTWGLTRAATAAAGMNDTSRLKAYADTIARISRLSALERDRRLHYYVRANVLVSRGALKEAVDEYRRAMESPTFGYTRINLELGRVLLMLGRYAEAAVVVRAALHGSLESSNYYVTRTELHELLAYAFDLAGEPDSAGAHYAKVTAAWANGDPEFKGRARVAEQWLRNHRAR
jgi:tetratricopeptide (TPR) repeat protein/tRNA A-37 threonylcarbamoyl transferase component Bud32